VTGEHYEDWELLAFVDGTADLVDLGAAATHLHSCMACRQRISELRSLLRLLADPDVHAFARRKTGRPLPAHVKESRALARRMAAEDAAAEHTFAALMARPIEAWEAYLNVWPGLRTEGLIRRLIMEARGEYDRRAEHALRLLQIGVAVANTLPDPLAVGEQRATLAKERANALRMLSRYPEALEALDEAERFMDDLPINAVDRALVVWARATVLFSMTRYAEALPLVRHSIKILLLFGEIPRAQQAKLLEAGIVYETGEVASARRMYEELTPYFEQLGDAETTARLLADRAECAMRLDDPVAARRHADEAMALYERLGKPSEKTRVQWTLAHMLLQQGRGEDALDDLHSAATAFEALGMRAEAGGALLDIVQIFVSREEWDAAIPLARYLATLFTGIGVPVHTATAYAYLRDAVEAERASTELVGYIRAYAALPNPAALPFAPPN